MRYFLVVCIGLFLASCGHKGSDVTTRTFKSKKDSLNGNYDEVLRVNGIPVSMKCYKNYKVVMKGIYENGYLSDLMTVDSLENILRHLPIVVWTNPNNINNLDTLKFKIKNVDSLTFYQYFYTTNLTKFLLEEYQIKDQKPLHVKDEPIIKIPASELLEADIIYLKCGVLISITDSATIEIHDWGYFMNEFELKEAMHTDRQTLHSI